MRKIIRDFVTSWFSTVSSESTFERQVQTAMVSMAMEMKTRARRVDRKVSGSLSGFFEKPKPPRLQSNLPLKCSNGFKC